MLKGIGEGGGRRVICNIPFIHVLKIETNIPKDMNSCKKKKCGSFI